MANLDDVFSITAGFHGAFDPKKHQIEDEIPHLGISNLNLDGSFNLEVVNLAIQAKDLSLEINDVLIPTMGAALRNEESALAFHLTEEVFLKHFVKDEKVALDKYLLRVRFKDIFQNKRPDLCSKALCCFINTPGIQAKIRSQMSSGTIQPVLSKKELTTLKIPHFGAMRESELLQFIQLLESGERLKSRFDALELALEKTIEPLIQKFI